MSSTLNKSSLKCLQQTSKKRLKGGQAELDVDLGVE